MSGGVLWSAEEDQFMMDNYERLGAQGVADSLGRTLSAVYVRRKILSHDLTWLQNRYRQARACRYRRNELSRQSAARYRTEWTDHEDQFVLETIDDSAEDVAAVLERTVYAVYTRRRDLKDGRIRPAAERQAYGVRGGPAVIERPAPTCPRCFAQHPGEC